MRSNSRKDNIAMADDILLLLFIDRRLNEITFVPCTSYLMPDTEDNRSFILVSQSREEDIGVAF